MRKVRWDSLLPLPHVAWSGVDFEPQTAPYKEVRAELTSADIVLFSVTGFELR